MLSREISGAADVVWVTEKGDSCDPFTQDDAGGTPAPQLFRDHNSQVLAVRNCVRPPLWQAARSARTQRAAKLSSLPAPRAQGDTRHSGQLCSRFAVLFYKDAQATLQCAGPAAALADPQQFAKLLRRLHRHDWVVYAKPAFGGPMQVLRYLGRYTHRVAISNHRLLAFDQERVTFRWKDYARGGKQGQMTLPATEFLRRFFLHVLPKGFVRIRHFGFLANRFRASRLALSRINSAGLEIWRRGRDSNPRYSFPYSSFQDWRLQPLGHLSDTTVLLQPRIVLVGLVSSSGMDSIEYPSPRPVAGDGSRIATAERFQPLWRRDQL